MLEVVLAVVVVALLVERVVTGRAHARERRHLTNAVIAKNGGELLALDREPREQRDVSESRTFAMQLDNPLGIG
jgi:hypothetical protein